MSTSFEDFLQAMDSGEVSHGAVREVDDTDDLGIHMEKGWEYDAAKEELFDELDFGYTDKDLDPNLEGSFEEESLESSEDEDTEEDTDSEEDVEIEEIEDWTSSVILPDGTEVSANELKEYKDFSNKYVKFQDEVGEYHKREQILVQKATFGYEAIVAMENVLKQTAAGRHLSQKEVVQAELLQMMKTQFTDFEGALKNTYSTQLSNQAKHVQQTVDNNITTLFETYGDAKFSQELLPSIEKYVSAKGLNAQELMKNINYDPKIMAILVDASEMTRVKNKVTLAPKQNSRAIKGRGKGKASRPTIPSGIGISSRDMGSFSEFSAISGIFD